MWKGDFTQEEVDDHIPYGLENKIAYPSIEWVDIGIIETNTLGGNFFLCLCNEVFFLPNIALTCEKK